MVGSVTFDVATPLQLNFSQNQVAILINNIPVYSVAGSFAPKSYLAFRDYGLCFGPVVNYVSNLNITPLNPEDGQFTGKKYDPGTGLVYFGGRFYDPEIGRFINQDPSRQGLNYYMYCNNNPLSYADPDGKCPLFVITGIAGVLIGGAYGAYTSYKATGNVNWETVGKDAVIGGLIGTGAGALAGALYAGTSAAITIATESGVSIWGLSAIQRGQIIEKALGGMCTNFPTIDKFVNGEDGIASSITSIKSMDLGAASYQTGNTVFNTIMGYANTLADFDTTTWNYITVNVDDSTQRILQLVIPEGATDAQQSQIQAATDGAAEEGVQITVTTAN